MNSETVANILGKIFLWVLILGLLIVLAMFSWWAFFVCALALIAPWLDEIAKRKPPEA